MVDKAQVENVLGRLPSVEAELGDPDVLKDRRRYLATLADYRFLKKLDYVSCSPYRVPIARLAAAQAALRK